VVKRFQVTCRLVFFEQIIDKCDLYVIMKTVVITGGTRGIGAGLVRDFLKLGWNVSYSGASDISVEKSLVVTFRKLQDLNLSEPLNVM
jgi:hypothetical protein